MLSLEKNPTDNALSPENFDVFLNFYRIMRTAREIDRLEEQFTNRGEAFFHASGAGHEASAVLAHFLKPEDWLHCHYRDKALMVARGISPEMFFHGFFAKDHSHSRGRQMNAHMADFDHNILSMCVPVGNNALQAIGVAAQVKDQPARPLVLCSFGDGTSQQGEVLEAIGEAVRSQLPVLFLIQNNQWAISKKTEEQTFFSLPGGEKPDSFYGVPIYRVNGSNALACYNTFAEVTGAIRETRKPAFIQMDVERLSNHSNADDQSIYREELELSRNRLEGDPILHLAKELKQAGIAPKELEAIDAQVKENVRAAAESSQRSPDPKPIFDAKPTLSSEFEQRTEYRGSEDGEQLTMLEAMRSVFHQRMAKDPSIYLYGQDIEDPKGDVFGLTRGLTEAFPQQIKNSPLTESTILGACIGRAAAGAHPVAFIQFADFLPLALNQIMSELSSMYWRTAGVLRCPLIVMITCGGYRAGLGPFHAQTFESIAAHTPGLDVFMPATAGDAAGLLNAAFDSKRPTLFFYPKSCLNERDRTTSALDIDRQFVPLGKARVDSLGQDLTLVAWGNTLSRCRQAVDALEKIGITTTLLDLRSLSPWDEKAVLDSVRSTRRLIVVHEDNLTCGFGAEVLATVLEKIDVPIQAKRLAREDTHIPFNFANQLEVLPSFKRILSTAAEMLDLDLSWQLPPKSEPGIFNIEAVGTSPSDEIITLVQWNVKEGQVIKEGDLLATFEADKAAADLEASVGGEILEILIPEGETAKVGDTLLKLKLPDTKQVLEKPITQEQSGTPILKRRTASLSKPTLKAEQPLEALTPSTTVKVGIQAIGTALGSNKLTNEILLKNFPHKTAEDIERTTGISSRPQVAEGETALSLALDASQKALKKAGLSPKDLDLLICSTGTPGDTTPSMACKILYGLDSDSFECPAYDISAACSGYLYALQSAYDFLQSKPETTVLLVTTEVLTPLTNPNDFNTAIIFGDAATATVIRSQNAIEHCPLKIGRPNLSAQGEPGRFLRVPSCASSGSIFMEGSKAFSEGVRKMVIMLQRVCSNADLNLDDLALIVPHQANQRILNAILKRLDLPSERIYSNIKYLGNTSSCTIPLCLAEILPSVQQGQHIALTAFGGGFTFGACLLEGI